MGTLTADTILLQAGFALNDVSRTTWPKDELLLYLEDGQRAAVLARPEVNPITKSVQLVTGSRQTIPDDGYVLLDVVRNMGTDGATPGGSITPTGRASLDQASLDWHMLSGADATVLNYVYDVRNRKTFYVYPPQPTVSPNQIEITYAGIPARFSDPDAGGSKTKFDDTIKLDDIYAPALVAYVLHRAYVKDVAAEAGSMQKSQMYFDWFGAMITGNADAKDEDIVRRHEVGEAAVFRRQGR